MRRPNDLRIRSGEESAVSGNRSPFRLIRTLLQEEFKVVILLRRLLLVLGAVALVFSIPPPALAAQGHGATVSAAPGTLVRWAAPGARRCSMKGRSWAALEGTCYYPVDLLQKPALITIALWGSGHREFARISWSPTSTGPRRSTFPTFRKPTPRRRTSSATRATRRC